MKIDLPPISVLIPTFNEEKYIRRCVESLLNGEYPTNKLEILIIDGNSSDDTRKIVAELSAEHSSVKLLRNTKKIVPAALNIGVANAKNNILVWVGAHATYSKNYLTQSVSILLESNCASVGGVLKAVGKNPFARAIAVATNSKFGIGAAKYRHASSRQIVDTVFGGCWRKTSIEKIGGFNEHWVRNQDYELNLRLRHEIGEIILDPSIQCEYFCRDSLKSLTKQYFQYGFWRFQTVMKYPESFSIRLAAPVLLLIGLITSIIMAPFSYTVAALVPSAYVIAIMGVTSYQSIKESDAALCWKLPAIYPTLHLSWGLGFLAGGATRTFRRVSDRTTNI